VLISDNLEQCFSAGVAHSPLTFRGLAYAGPQILLTTVLQLYLFLLVLTADSVCFEHSYFPPLSLLRLLMGVRISTRNKIR